MRKVAEIIQSKERLDNRVAHYSAHHGATMLKHGTHVTIIMADAEIRFFTRDRWQHMVRGLEVNEIWFSDFFPDSEDAAFAFSRVGHLPDGKIVMANQVVFDAALAKKDAEEAKNEG